MKFRGVCLLIGAALALVIHGVVSEGVGADNKPATAAGAIPITFALEKPAYVTLVIEDGKGQRVRNLLAETFLPAGKNSVFWDGYDEGARDVKGGLERRRVTPGAYHLRGLTHDGIKMHYEMTVDNPGQPPWETKDGSGAWLADHSPPADVLTLPKGTPSPNGKGEASFLVCSTSGEAGSEFVWLNAEGRRLYGTNDGFWGGTHLSRDSGPNPCTDYYAYVFQSGQRDPDNFTIEVRGFKTKSGQIEKVAFFPRPKTLRTFQRDEAYGNDGVAVYNGRIVFAVTMLNKLVAADARTRNIVGTIDLVAPRAPFFDKEGRLFIITEGKVKRFGLVSNELKLHNEKTIVADNLVDPRRLKLDNQGNIYVSDWGTDHQIKIFNPEGSLLRKIGKPGGPQIGIYDDNRMAHPCGFDLDNHGQLWVAEGDLPRRLSIWKTDGNFVRALYGPTKYGGGGTLDPLDKTRFYYDDMGKGVEFALDWQTGTSKVKSVYWRSDMMSQYETLPGAAGVAPQRAFHFGGHQYMVSSYNGDLRFNQDRGMGIWRMDKYGIARPVALIGNAADLVNGLWGWRIKNRDDIVKLWEGPKPDNVLFVWSDSNGDGVAQTDEIQWVAEDNAIKDRHYSGGLGLEPLVHADMSFTTTFGTHVPSPKVDSRGTPIYDLKQRKRVGDINHFRPPQIAGDRIVTHGDGEDGTGWMGFDLQGGKRWRYTPTPEHLLGGPGAMIAPTRILGPDVTPKTGQAGPLVAINGEMGAVFLLTADGLFLQTLGGDSRQFPRISEHNPKRDWIIDNITFQQEHFHPTINQTADGNIYLVAGFQQSMILRLDGFENVRRHDFGQVTVGEKELAGIPATFKQNPRKEGRVTQTIALLKKPLKLDGTLSDWPTDTQWMPIDERASAAIALDAQNFYVAYRTGNPLALDNAGGDYRYLFKNGGAFDIMLGTNSQAPHNRHEPAAGDLRLLVTRSEGKTRAVVYRAIDPEAAVADKVLYESPVGKVSFDRVQLANDVSLAQKDGNFELSIPLKTLGLNPSKGMEFLADVGILRGGDGRTMKRAYWSNQNTTIVSDLPSEAKLQPREWGVWKVR